MLVVMIVVVNSGWGPSRMHPSVPIRISEKVCDSRVQSGFTCVEVSPMMLEDTSVMFMRILVWLVGKTPVDGLARRH